MTGTALVMPQTLSSAPAAKPKSSGAADPNAELRLLPEFSGLFAALESGQRSTPEPGSEADAKGQTGEGAKAAVPSPLDLLAGFASQGAWISQPSPDEPKMAEPEVDTASAENAVASTGVQPAPIVAVPPAVPVTQEGATPQQAVALGTSAAIAAPPSQTEIDADLPPSPQRADNTPSPATAVSPAANVAAANAGAAVTKAETAARQDAPVQPSGSPATEPVPMGGKGASGEGGQAGDGQNRDGAEFLAAAKDAKMTVVRQETHFAPASGLSPAHQLASQILQDIDASRGPEAQRAVPVAENPQAGAGPLKTLQIQLDPPELGLLTVRMSLKDDVLNLQIQASRHETAKMIQGDQEAISKLLRSAGYAVEGMTIQVTSGDRASPAAAAYAGAGSFGQSSGQQSSWRNEERGEGRRLRHASAAERIAETIHATEPAGGVGPHRRGLVYL